MTWIKFTIWLSGLYIAYYLFLILFDVLKGKNQPAKSAGNELTFSEHFEPVSALPDPDEPGAGDPVIASGGVSLKQMFSLAREEAIEYIRPVSFV
jgi:hypothetical protein